MLGLEVETWRVLIWVAAAVFIVWMLVTYIDENLP